jgi:hypothetical protein
MSAVKLFFLFESCSPVYGDLWDIAQCTGMIKSYGMYLEHDTLCGHIVLVHVR